MAGSLHDNFCYVYRNVSTIFTQVIDFYAFVWLKSLIYNSKNF